MAIYRIQTGPKTQYRLICRIIKDKGSIRFSGSGTHTDPIHLSADGLSVTGLDIIAETARQLYGREMVDVVYSEAWREAGM